MLKLMKDDENEGLFETEDEHGVKRQVYYEEDEEVFILGSAPLDGGYHDDLDELDGILPELDRSLEDAQITLERLKAERGRVFEHDELALYLALETKVAQFSGYVQGLTFVRERLGNGEPRLEFGENDVQVSLQDSKEAQATLDSIVRRIDGLLERRAAQKDFN